MTAYRSSARLRLAAQHAVFTLVGGGLLLVVLYLVVRAGVEAQPFVPDASGRPADLATTFDPGAAVELKQRHSEAERELRAQLVSGTLTPMLTTGLAVLAGLTAVAAAVGWWAAGHALSPIRAITSTARRIADRNLHERIGLAGHRDEWGELADTFDGMLARLDSAFEGQRRFVANASHELKTPLAVNRTLLEVAMNRPGAPPELLALGETLLEVNSRHENLVDGLLTLARSEQGVTDPVVVDLTEIVRSVVELARVEADRLRVALSLEAAPAPVSGDPLLLERLVQNLVRNGIRHNEPNGWVRVRAHRGADGVELAVSNTGPVVVPAMIPALFEPFHRAAGRVGSARGTGLGLSIVRSVVGVHGGTLTATAREGGGMDVVARLPAAGA